MNRRGGSSLEDREREERRRLVVRGTVQGVGFRPFVYRLAREHELTGWVRNTSAGVEIEVEGSGLGLDAFVRRLRTGAPPLARIERIESRTAGPRGDLAFTVLPSRARDGEIQPISPDVASCAACMAEVNDPAARRYRYPFTNCTACGPRFTIIEALPYDRERTSMRRFALCAACRAEYEEPADRRFHAEPIACPECGPRLEFVDLAQGPAGPEGVAAESAVSAAVAALRGGRIVAIRGLGGFQLACDATDPVAVRRLRERKAREAKPFAVMVPDLDVARALCGVDDAEAALLGSPRAPIVLLRGRDRARVGLAPEVAPGLDSLGVMLPSTPLHHLLLRAFGRPLVMTSGNRSAEPIALGNGEALERLDGVADVFLLHVRDIVSRYDDSVARMDRDGEVVLRRARGYAPEPIRLPARAALPILAVGPQLKNTFCLVREDQAFVSQHIGDLDDALTLAHYHRTLELYRRLFGVEPGAVAHDLHPDYATTRFAEAVGGVPLVGVQHHHAHAVGCLAEHGVMEPAIGVAFDGAGYGPDGAVWGGELLLAEWKHFRRAAHLAYLPLPGGDAAAREPWRMALAALAHAFGEEAEEIAGRLLPDLSASRRRPVLRMARGAVNAPPTSSAGRLFDAVAALAGVRQVNGYEGQAAMELEARVDPAEKGAYPLPLRVDGASGGGTVPVVWDLAPLIRAVVDDVRRGVCSGSIAARFHNALAAAVVEGCLWLRETEGLNLVALSGGCFQNRRLLELTRAGLERAGFRVLAHRRVPPNDGGVSLGQAAVALATLRE
jgi:hydrogenase maturation protein HypF